MRAKILRASAGSGKTYRLAYKFVHDTVKYFHSKPYLYRAILAVTFTNKATEEMKSRILRELGDLSQSPDRSSYMSDLKRDLYLSAEEITKRATAIQRRILHDYSRFTILTIDKFFQRILRSFIKELGLDLNYNIELDTATVLAQSTDSLIEEITTNEELQRWMMEFAQDRIDENGAWDLRSKMNTLGQAIFDESSKQTIQNSTPKEVLRRAIASAEERSAKARAELKALGVKAVAMMDEAGVEPSDFAGKSRSFAFIFHKIAAESDFNLTKTVRKMALSPEGWASGGVAKVLATRLQPLLAEVCDVCDRSAKLWATLPLVKQTYRSYALLQDIYRKVRERCDEEGIMLLSETKYILSRFIEGNDAPFIYEKTGNRFERFMIDEFQDTSLKEWGNFVPLLRNAMAQSEDTSVLIVGDVKQSIYRWRGGDWCILSRGVGEALGEQDTEVEPVKTNYRSLPLVVEFNNKVVGSVVSADNAALNEQLDQALEAGRLSRQCHDELYDTLRTAYIDHDQTPCRKSQKEGYVCVETFDEEPPIVACIESAIERGYSYSDIMILCRERKDGARAAKILMEYKRRNNAFNIMTQDSLIVGRAAISNFLIAVMRLSQDQRDTISLAIVNDYLGREYDAQPDEQDRARLSHISQLTPEQAFEYIVAEYDLGSRCDEIAYLQAVHEQIVAFSASKVADIQLFLRMWDEKGAAKALSVERSEATIELTTIHKAKGLEKKVVIIPYCNWRLNPITNSIVWATPDLQGDALAEVGRFPVSCSSQRMGESIFSDEYYREYVYSHVDGVNMLYVALTRAKEELYAFVPMGCGKESAGRLLWEAVKNDAQSIDDKTSRAEYGRREAPEPEQREQQQVRNVLLDDYPTSRRRMALSLPSQRYFGGEDGDRSLSPRSVGVMMHGVLCEATDAEDAMQRLEQQRLCGRLSDEQARELEQTIRREFSRDQVREWFGEWDEVRCENDILATHQAGTRRPDRVMIQGERAVVVDYKFGEEQVASYRRQVASYMNLLREMGYRRVEGYVWYLTLGEIVSVGE